MKIIVEEARTGKILSRDVRTADKPKVVVNLSGACVIEFSVAWGEPSVEGIDFKSFGQWIHVEEYVGSQRKIIAASLVREAVPQQDGTLKVRAEGYSSYPQGIPWLENYNPVVVDPFAIVHRIWNHVQSYTHGNLGVTVTPAESGTFLLPGFGFDGIELVLDFFAIYVRAADYKDCGEEMVKLAKDIPFDYLETASWNAERTAISKNLQLSYPKRGVRRNELAFRLGENVLAAAPQPESEIEWTSDVIVRGWFPGRVYSSQFTNNDNTRYRRVIMEDDAKINSNERAQVWAKRQLTRRQVPNYWSTIMIDMNHPNAPFGSWELGDEIFVEGFMPWVGEVRAWHRILSYSYNENGALELQLRHEGAFNYDPLEFQQ